MFGTYSSRQVIKLTCPDRGHWISISHLTLKLLSLSRHCVLKLHLQQRGLSGWWRWCPHVLRVKHSSASSTGLHGRAVSVFVCGACGLPVLCQALKQNTWARWSSCVSQMCAKWHSLQERHAAGPWNCLPRAIRCSRQASVGSDSGRRTGSPSLRPPS